MYRSSTTALPRRYANPRRISVGGMGEIFLVDDVTLGRRVVLKLLADLYARDQALRRRFLREANAAAKLSGHPNVVTIYDVGEWDDRPFIAMEYVQNGDLRDRLSAGTPDAESALEWISQAGSALDAAHAMGIVHRDVKPANLLLDGRCTVKVADFGIALVLDAATTSVTMPGTILGTAGYISPEQASGQPATAASDIYSLAVVAFELLTGRRPFAGTSDTEELAAHVHAPVPQASPGTRLPAAIDSVFERALAKDPAQRPSTAAALVDQLRAALASAGQRTLVMTPVAAPSRPMSTYRHGGRSRGGKRALLIGAVAAAALAIGLVAAISLARHGGGSSAAPSPRTVLRVRTVQQVVTRQGTTVTVPRTQIRTVTVSTGETPTAAADPAAGHALNDRGYSEMRRGNYAAALPLLEQAVTTLRGTGPQDPYEAYANYNLGYTLLELGRCQEATVPLERARRLESSPAVPRALRAARACA
jgi:eukaryotic-like serine/threonine-protein kinase